MKKVIKGIFNFILVLLVLSLLAAGAGLVYLTINEFSPDSSEKVEIYGSPTIEILPGDKLKVMTFNIGSAVKTAGADNCCDGGSTVHGASSTEINSALNEIAKLTTDKTLHISFFQEVDVDSRRSFSVDEASTLSNTIHGRANAFAFDRKCEYAPVPFSHLGEGKVESGILTLTRFGMDSAERIALPNDSAWPASTWSRKPAMLVERVKLGDTTKELVLININFEMYDDGSVREAEFKSLCEFMQMEFAKGNYVIAGGSFGAALPSVDKSKNTDDGGDIYMPHEFTTEQLTGGWKYCTDDSSPTMRLMTEPFGKDTPVYVTDGFITSPNTITENTETIDMDFKLSSHNPVISEITLVK